MDQMKYSSFNKKIAEDFATGWENVYLIHIEDAQHVYPSTSMIMLIMISGRSNKRTMTNVVCPQRMKIIQPLDGRMMGRVWCQGSPK